MTEQHAGHDDYGHRPRQRRLHNVRPARKHRQADPPDNAPGICRICRSEGSPSEPLFYPCRCSGSIRHVHQDCLMEWLSHSQKKYCELCKTPFRFTKFYSPNMPQSLPLSVFFRQLSQYVIENGLGWLRAIIAISFWATVLPWFMRRGWSSMLWLSQESWGGSPGDPTTPISTSGYTIHLSSTMIGLDTCPSSPLFAPTSTPAADIETMMDWWGSHTISGALLRMLRRMTGLHLPAIDGSGHLSNTSRSPQTYETGSLLGNVQFLKTLTRNKVFNQAVISVLEGQIVTVVVIVSFILVILVRDYVVQQQPDLNLNGRGAFDVPEDGEQVPIAVQPARPPVADDTDESENEELGLGGPEQVPSQHAREARGAREQHFREAFPELAEVGEAGAATRSGDVPENSTAAFRPLPDRAGEPSSNPGPPNRWADVVSSTHRSSDEGSTDTILTPDYSQEDLRELASSVTEGKGKAKTEAPVQNAEQPSFQPLHSGPGPSSRPRSISDGPQVQGNVNPLSNNTWSFTPNLTEQTSSDREDAPSSQLTFSRHGTMTGMPGQEYMRHDESEYSPGVFPHDDFDEAVDDGLPEDLATHAPRLRSPSASPPPEPRTVTADPRGPLSDWVTHFMWGDIEISNPGATVEADSEDADDERFEVESDAESEDDMDGQLFPDDIPDEAIDGDAAGVDGIPGPAMDPEAIEDMEDFEGIMELLGMRGPITNLFQNVIFCAVLVQSALFSCVFIPFNVGRMAFWFAAKPMRIIRILFELSKVTQDLCFVIGGVLSWMTFNLADMLTSHIGGPVAAQVLAARKGSWVFFTAAGSRVGTFLELLVLDLSVPASGMQYWSAVSHEALMSIKSRILASFLSINSLFTAIATDPIQLAWSTPGAIWGAMSGLFAVLSNPGSWVLEFTPDQTAHVQLGHAHWQSGDITWAILAGYATVFTLAGLYLKSGIRLARGTALEDWESGIIDFLHQASGILKVITIISIEMLVFPLYCGLLLDCALLPLFSGASVKSRLLFTYNNPWTSIFVHWFVGTGYMFHFALFVSMCRKIMRPGVLYFIRDPDDPEFHPVRDVLERNLTTQLRKILFSAFVYGALVIVCLGGVVWGLAYMAPNVLPIHYSSNDPVLEFPVDLLFYNLFMPVAVAAFRPGDALHTMYRWCFRKSARILRLTYFLFGERRIDEEGTLRLPKDSPGHNAPIYRQAFLGLDSNSTKVIVKSWKDIFDDVDTESEKSTPQEIKRLRLRKALLVDAGQLIKDGRFVRAPASDRVKIPKGRRVFLDVNERGLRTDGKPDEGLYASEQFEMVYVPPHLVMRIFLFILFVWTFAAVTGVGLTIIPLVLGRMMFKMALPSHVKTNDIYAFCIGIHVVGFAAYALLHIHKLWAQTWNWFETKGDANAGSRRYRDLARSLAWAAKVVYAYTWILVVCPLIISILLELYVEIPIHTLMNPPTENVERGEHTIRIVESWTLGLLYMRLAVKFINSSSLFHTRFAAAMRAILRRGWLEPNIGVLTRAFVLPGLLVSGIAIFGPSLFVWLLERQDLLLPADQLPAQAVDRASRYRLAYPVVFVLAMMTRYAIVMKGGFDTLKAQIRDDAYLMGERLQNYDGSPPDTRTGKGQRPATRQVVN